MSKRESSEMPKRVQDFIAEAKRLRAAAHEWEADFFAWLMLGEEDEGMWRFTGAKTWGDFLRSHDVVKPERYSRYKALVERHGADVVRRVGFDAASVLLVPPPEAKSITEPETLAVDAIKRDLLNFRVKNRTTPSGEHAENIRKTHYVRQRPPKEVANEDYDTIKRERDKLLVKVAEQAHVIAQKDKTISDQAEEIHRLRERLAGARLPAPARSGKGRGKSEGQRPQA